MLASSTAKGGGAVTTATVHIPAAFRRLRSDPNATLVLDGGTGEELFRRGVPDDRKIWSATAVVNTQYHDTLREVHRSFVRAGAGAVTTNSYGITPGVGFSDEEIARHVETSGRLAREAVDGMKNSNGDGDGDGNVLVLGSLGPLQESYRPDRLLPRDRGVAVYRLMAKALSPYVDCYLAETMSSVEEASQAVAGVGEFLSEQRRLREEEDGDKAGGVLEVPQHPMMCSYTLRGDGRLRSGESAPDGVRGAIDACREIGVHLLGVMFNCCEPEAITMALRDVRTKGKLQGDGEGKGGEVLLGAYANRLTAIASDWSLEGSDGPQEMRKDLSPGGYYDDFVRSWVTDWGVRMVGGCCGMTPEHIERISSNLGGTAGNR